MNMKSLRIIDMMPQDGFMIENDIFIMVIGRIITLVTGYLKYFLVVIYDMLNGDLVVISDLMVI